MSITTAADPKIAQISASVFHHLLAYPALGSFNVDALAAMSAGVASSQYAVRKMAKAARLSKEDLIKFCLDSAPKDGLVLEFGVYSGSTVNLIATHYIGTVYGFDSFEGLPEDWRKGFAKGAFSLPNLPAVAPNVELIAGLFEASLPAFLAQHDGQASFIHIDCDLYSSTRTVLTEMRDRMVAGTIILFDEYFNYPSWELHEFKAFQEFIADTGIQYEYIALNPAHQQVAVRLIDVPAAH